MTGMDTSATAVWSTLDRWPLGYFTATYDGRRYGVTRSVLTGGRSMKLWAEELGGADRIRAAGVQVSTLVEFDGG